MNQAFNPKPRFESLQKPGTIFLQTVTYSDPSVTYNSSSDVYSGTPSQEGRDHIVHQDIDQFKPVILSIQNI